MNDPTTQLPDVDHDGIPSIDLSDEDRCDPLVPARCLLPFPNDHFTVTDPASPTKRRVAFSAASLPANAAGQPTIALIAHLDTADAVPGRAFSPSVRDGWRGDVSQAPPRSSMS